MYIDRFVTLILCLRRKQYHYCYLTCKKIWTYYIIHNYINDKCNIIYITNIDFDEESMGVIIEDNEDLFNLIFEFSRYNNILGINVFDNLFRENKIKSDIGDIAITVSVQCNDYKLVKLLIKYIDPSIDNNNLIRTACRNGYYDITKLLLNNPKVDPTAYYNYPIRIASQNGSYRIVKKLLKDPRVDPYAVGNFALRCAKKNGHYDIVKLLLNHIK